MANLKPKATENVDDLDFMPRVLCAAETANEVKATDIVAYDVRGLTLIADSFVLCSANSEPQLRAISAKIQAALRDIGVKPLHVEGESGTGWIVLDYSTVIVHIFKKESRTFYDLDGLWGDAPKFPLELD